MRYSKLTLVILFLSALAVAGCVVSPIEQEQTATVTVVTDTLEPTNTSTLRLTVTATATNTPQPTSTWTPTSSPTPQPTPTPTSTETPTWTPKLTSTPTHTPTPESAYVQGAVYHDLDNDGQHNDAEPALARAVVEVRTYPDGGFVAVYTTRDDGQYMFSLMPGTYRIEQVQSPPGYVLSPSYYAPLIETLHPGQLVAWNFANVQATPTPTSTTTPTSTYTPTPSPTDTPILPTPTPTNTNTPSPTPTHTPTVSNVLFEDTFDLRMKLEWQPESGTWRVVNEQLTADRTGGWVYIFAGDENWTDYTVDVDVNSCWVVIRFIVRRVGNSFMAVRVWDGGVQWELVREGQWSNIGPAGIGANPRCRWTHYTIRVTGDIYEIYHEDVRLIQLQDSTFSQGQVGLAFEAGGNVFYDNFKVTALETDTEDVRSSPPTSPAPPKSEMLAVGEGVTVDGVTLTLDRFELNAKEPWYGKEAAIVLFMSFTNNTGQDILLRFAFGDFTLEDNSERTYGWVDDNTIVLSPGYTFFRNQRVSRVLKDGQTLTWHLPFGKSGDFDKDVQHLVLTADRISEIDRASWKIDIQ